MLWRIVWKTPGTKKRGTEILNLKKGQIDINCMRHHMVMKASSIL